MRSIRPNAGPSRRTSGVFSAQAMVEFAAALVFVLLPMILGVIEVGRGVWYYNQLSHLSREGARWLVVSSAQSTDYTRSGNAPGTYIVGACSCGGTAVAWIGAMDVGIPTSAITVTITREVRADGYYYGVPATVAVNYPYRPVVTSLLNIPATVPISAQTTMQME